MARTAESIVRQMVDTGIMVEDRMTPRDRRGVMRDYADLVLRMIFNDDHASNLQLRDGIAYMHRVAQEKGLEKSLVIAQAIDDMRKIEKEISVVPEDDLRAKMLGDAVSQCSRTSITFRNVVLDDNGKKENLDQVMITSNGILILEAKNYVRDTVIKVSGRIYDISGNCYLDQSLGDQMARKRSLLKSSLENVLAENNQDIPVHADSIVVFTGGTSLVVDHYQEERICYSANLPYEIERYSSNVSYNPHEMFTLGKAIEKLLPKPEVCDVGMDFYQIRRNFATALVLLENTPFAYAIVL